MLERATRRLALVARLAETWARRPATPTRVVMDLTRRCNLRCEMCLTWQRRGGTELTAREIGTTLGRMTRLTWLDLTGGEPFVRKDIAAVFEHTLAATPALHVLHFQTNGWSTPRIVETTEAVRRAREDIDLIVTVSIDGPPAVHDGIRGRAGSFARAISTAAALREVKGVDVHIGTTVTATSARHLDALGALLRRELPRFDDRRWHINWAQVSGHFYGNGALRFDTRGAPETVRDHLRRRGRPRSLVEAMETAYLVNLEAHLRGEAVGIPCQALRSTMFIAPEGDVYPCHIYDRPLGNVRQRDVLEIWNSAAVATARRDIERLRCGGCFSACEAYPALAGAPVAAAIQTARRGLRLWRATR